MTVALRTRVYHLLSLGFRRPTRAQVEVLAGEEMCRVLSELADLSPLPPAVEHRDLERFSQDVERIGAEAVARDLRVEYCRLFLAPGAGPCPPYGSLYLDGRVMGPSTVDVARRYRSEGLAMDGSWREPPDHIAVELAFMAQQSAAHTRAIEANDRTEAARLRAVQTAFLRDHLGRWGPRFAETLERATGTHLYRFLSNFLQRWLWLDRELLRAGIAGMEVNAACR